MKNKIRRDYSDEEKINSVKLMKRVGATQAARRTGIPNSTIATWAKKIETGKLKLDTKTIAVQMEPQNFVSSIEKVRILKTQIIEKINRLQSQLTAIELVEELLKSER